MNLESKLLLASKNPITGVTLYTFMLTFPRVILAEVNTHRMLSRNTASSRAIPSWKQRRRVLRDPFIPISIGQNQKGMQAGEELAGWRRHAAILTWKAARYPAALASWLLDKTGAHKQVVNRLVEPWTWTQQLVTATDLKNVFLLRNHSAAEPHFHMLARQMERQVQYAEQIFSLLGWNAESFMDRRLLVNGGGIGTLQVLRPGEWHLPFVDDKDLRAELLRHVTLPSDKEFWETLKQVSAARCARVSYYLSESGERSSLERDLELCARLSSAGHWSPFEHPATPVPADDYIGNYRSWRQYRKEFPNEHGGDREHRGDWNV